MLASNTADKRKEIKRHGCPGEHPYGDRGQIVFLFVFLLIWVLDSFLFKWTTILAAVVPLPVRLGLAGLIFILAGYFVQTGHRVISGPSFRDKGLKKDEAFARLRHPLYGGSMLFYLSLVISTLSLAAFAVWCVIFIFYNIIAGYEERLLLEKYGDEYLEYQRKVPRWFPRLRPARFG
ncbi:MAG: isoprenylcysteine carboxylmethyltransferase family protein [Candidatus Aminicenantes bacterium]|nr:isoprenylcysteine carboxylmethyltransferase family protein [Candidatus Aminicenantes bacterium]